jgi:hypothetical protein
MTADVEQDDLFVRHLKREDDAVVVGGVPGVIALSSRPTSRRRGLDPVETMLRRTDILDE